MKSQKLGMYLLTALLLGFIVVLFVNMFYYLGLLLKISGNAILFEDLPASTSYAYGRWIAVLIGIGIFSFFVLSFLMPTKKREWHSLGIDKLIQTSLIPYFPDYEQDILQKWGLL